MIDDFFDEINQAGSNSPQNQEMKMQDSANFNQQSFPQNDQNQQFQDQDNFFEYNQEQGQISAMKDSNYMTEQYQNMNQSPQQEQNFEQQIVEPQMDYSMGQVNQINQQEQYLKLMEEERNKKLIEKQIQESKSQEEILDNAKNWINNWRNERQQQIEAKKKLNRENELALQEASSKDTQYKTEWDKVIHNVDLKNSESQNGKEILRMKQAILGKNSDVSHKNQ